MNVAPGTSRRTMTTCEAPGTPAYDGDHLYAFEAALEPRHKPGYRVSERITPTDRSVSGWRSPLTYRDVRRRPSLKEQVPRKGKRSTSNCRCWTPTSSRRWSSAPN
jgi:hypothetical protein